MSEADVEQNEARRTDGAANDVYSDSFQSLMDKQFRSPVPVRVQSPDQEDMVNSELQEAAHRKHVVAQS